MNGHGHASPRSDKDYQSHGKGPARPNAATTASNKTHKDLMPNMAPASPVNDDAASTASPIDPISRQIFERTHTALKLPQSLHAANLSHATSGVPDDQSARQGSDSGPIRRNDSTASNKVTKDKKKGVSFLSRIMGAKKRDDSLDLRETASEVSENRSAGNEAELFSQPVGFTPKFPAPPRYIKVKAHNRKQKDFDRLFLAQVLLGGQTDESRKVSIDEKIHSITDDAHHDQAAHGPRSPSKAIWAMEFSKDGRYLAAAGQDKKLRVWEVISTPDEREIEDKDSHTTDSADDFKLNAPVFRQKLVREYDGHTSSILDLSWSKNNFLLSSSMDKTVRLYHVSRAECLCAFKHTDFVTSIEFHPRDDRFFLAGSLDSKIRLWSIPDKSVAYVQNVPDMVTAVAFTPDGKTAIAGSLGGLCVLYDTDGLKAHSQIHVKSARGRNSKGSKVTGIDTIAIPRENGQQDIKLLITSNDSRVRMYNLKDRNLEIKFRGNVNSCSQIHASFSDDGKYVICGSEDRKVYVWPTGPTERCEGDKRPMEVFEAHSTIVTSALILPTKTRRLLAQSGDPLYDLCNPPPVTLVSRAESVISSKAPTNNSGQSDEKREQAPSRKSDSPRRAQESPAYLARHSHPGGQIVVTADYSGQIKIFRQDCAHTKRPQESWDGASTFSKKMLGRSGSVNTRNSVASSHRNSVNLTSKNPSTDRILNWRSSIMINGNSTSNSPSEVNLRASLSNDRARSISPSKNWTKRNSLLQSSTPTSQQPTSPPTHHSVNSNTEAKTPQISINSPSEIPDSPGTFHSVDNQTTSPQRNPSLLPRLSSNPDERDLRHGDPLYLVEGQSFMAWDVERTFGEMASRTPRTPGLLAPNGNPMSRQQSYVSQLSSELPSSEGESDGAVPDQNQLKVISRGRGPSKRSEAEEEEDLKCKNCGNETFRATMTEHGQRLRCKKCGTLI